MDKYSFIGLIAAVLAGIWSCTTVHKIHKIQNSEVKAALTLPPEQDYPLPELPFSDAVKDTLRIVDFEGSQTIIMNAVRDEDGEMVATDRITPSYVTARFRNVAERHGKVDLTFDVRMPAQMLDSRWQLRLNPDMYVLEDSVRLDPIIVTGARYRKAQLRGYQQYQRFLDSIITDTTLFINKHDLEIFLERNLPLLYALRQDSTFVSDEQFASMYGVTEREAVEHYTYGMLVRWNRRREGMKDKMYRRYVKAPIVSEGIRLDTVIQNADGDFIYTYVQTVNTSPRLKKVDIRLSGDIREQDKRQYTIPRSEPLTFYISSIAGLADNTEKYQQKVISRMVQANTACYIEFPQGKADIIPALGNNPTEIGRIQVNIRDLLVNETFELDSMTIASFASPEGTVRANDVLCGKRAAAAADYFSKYVRHVKDSLEREAGVFMDLKGTGARSRKTSSIRYSSRSGGENWAMLDALVAEDPDLSGSAKEYYTKSALFKNPDERERALSGHASYKHLREHLYPRLRVVKFNFYLHRKGMVQDTVRTTELDTTYMRGVSLIRDRDYKAALEVLLPYHDCNTAVAFLALDRNASAMEILQTLPKNARTDYLTAIALSRQGDERGAVEHYLHACAQDRSFVHRGNLDPEIAALIRKYNLNGG